MLNDIEAKAAIEAILFMATDPLELKTIQNILNKNAKKTKNLLEEISLAYSQEDKGIELVKIGEGYQIQTKSQFRFFIKELHQPEMNNTLTQASLETLAIIAYKQPVTRAEVEDIRGVNVEKAIKTLQKRSLVEEKGRKDTIGNPIIYGTTGDFLQYMGLASLDELPPTEEFTNFSEEDIADEIEENS